MRATPVFMLTILLGPLLAAPATSAAPAPPAALASHATPAPSVPALRTPDTVAPARLAPGSAKLPDTPAARTADAFLRAFNSAEPDAMRAFLDAHLSAEARTRRPIEERLTRHRQMKADLGSLRLERVMASRSDGITALATTATGDWVEIGFECEPGPRGFLAGIRIEQAEPPVTGVGGQPSATGAASEPLPADDLAAAIGSEVERRARADEFSGTVLVAREGQPIFQRACGLAERRFEVPNRMDTRFNLGSIDKIFTRVAIGQLIEQGRLAFADTLGKYLQDFPPGVGGKVTIRHLLEMTSGLGDFFGPEFDAADKSRFRRNRDFLPLFVKKPLEFEPGARRRYSNAGYITLGLILEKITGKDYADYVRENICRPSRMNATDFYESDAPIANLAMGYTREGWGADSAPGAPPEGGGPSGGARRENIYTRPARGSAAGGGYSTAEDMLRFSLALAGGKLLGPALTGWIYTGEIPVTESVAASAPPRGRLGIAGGAPGINAVLETNVGSGYTVIVLSNYDPPSAETLGRAIRGLITRVAP